jgi:hypothetical protein
LASLRAKIEEKNMGGTVDASIMIRLGLRFRYVFVMAVTLSLGKMSVPEKLRMMEALWADLSRNSDALKSPDWHEAALKERKARIVSGQTAYMDWDRAKKEIRRRLA